MVVRSVVCLFDCSCVLCIYVECVCDCVFVCLCVLMCLRA